MSELQSRLRSRLRSTVIRVSAISLLLSAMAVSPAGAGKLQAKPSNPPARCISAIRKVNMEFDEPGPTYSFLFAVDSLAYCRPNDWVSAARSRVSKFRTIDDYNYQRVPAIALAGKDLVGLRKWMCDWMMRLRRENQSSDAYRVLLACGEPPGTDTRKGVKVITTTSTSTTTTLPAALPTVSLRLSGGLGSVSIAAKVVENRNGNALRYCILLNGRDFYDVAESLLVSDGDGDRRESGPLCLDIRRVGPWENDFEGLRGGIFGTYTNLSGCSNDSSGQLAICKTAAVSLRMFFENGREAVSNSVQIYLRNRVNLVQGSTGWWTTEYFWSVCREPVETDGRNWKPACPSGSN